VTAGIQLEAMNFFSDTQEIASRFADSIADLHDVFRCNGVDFGAPEDFFAFARTLKYHSELRGDVLRVVKTVMEGGTNVSFRTILTVIAVASGGPDVAASERAMSVPVKSVIESLIGVGAWSQPNADQPGAHADLMAKGTEPAPALETYSPDGKTTGEAGADMEANAGVPIVGAVGAEESSCDDVAAVESLDVSGHAGVEKVADDSSIASSIDEGLASGLNGDNRGLSDCQVLLNDMGDSKTLAESTVAESLTRLELNSLQLKIYLDSIDQRISRMEPRLENVAPLLMSTQQAHAREEPVVARFSAAIASDPSNPSGLSDFSGTAGLPAGRDFGAVRNDGNGAGQQSGAATASSAATGTLPALASAGTDSRQSKSEPARSGRRQIALPIFVCVAVLLVAASLFWRFGRDTGPVVDRGGNAAGTGASPGAAPSAGASQVASVGAPAAPARGSQGGSSAASDTGKGEGRGVAEKPAASAKRSAQIRLRSPVETSSSVASPTMAKGSAEATDASDDSSDDAAEVSSAPLSNRPVDVSSGVMAANLLSAPKPSYPRLASLMRTEGSVVMHAVISKEGTVEEVRVIKGHRLLRGAAKNAVRSWRYRPYKVGGVPVEVATTVSVDFNLHH
jgi:TonB family protein